MDPCTYQKKKPVISTVVDKATGNLAALSEVCARHIIATKFIAGTQAETQGIAAKCLKLIGSTGLTD